jgi:3-hydroxymyristoyl/3-hydroxydecanoyl-(acyl carrier protein) dehydratase
MKEIWSDFVKYETESDRIKGRFAVPPDSLWFDGHFPGDPILPGIALLKFVQEVLDENARRQGLKLTLKGFKRVRFRNIARPGCDLDVVILTKDNGDSGSRAFTIYHGQEVVCSGTVTIATDVS